MNWENTDCDGSECFSVNNIVVPFISSLLSDLHNITNLDSETMNRLVMILESLQGNYSNANQNLIQLNDDKNSLKDILENGNLATDVALKLNNY